MEYNSCTKVALKTVVYFMIVYLHGFWYRVRSTVRPGATQRVHVNILMCIKSQRYINQKHSLHFESYVCHCQMIKIKRTQQHYKIFYRKKTKKDLKNFTVKIENIFLQPRDTEDNRMTPGRKHSLKCSYVTKLDYNPLLH